MLKPCQPATLLALTDYLTGPRLGLLVQIAERRAPAASGLPIDHISGYRLPPSVSRHLGEGNGGGAPDRLLSIAAAIGEAVERYSLACHAPWRMRLSTANDLPTGGVLDPSKAPFFLDEQYSVPGFPFRKPGRNDVRHWIEGADGLTGETVWIPAELAHLPPPGGVSSLTYPLSVGTACAPDPWQAATRAVLELVERDSLAICWETRTAFPSIRQSRTDEVAARLFGNCQAFDLRCFDLTTDLGVPVILTLALSSAPGPAVAIGSAAGLSTTDALERAIIEAITSWRSSLRAIRSDKRSLAEVRASMDRFPNLGDHALYYAYSENLHHFNFLLSDFDAEQKFPNATQAPIKTHDSLESILQLLSRRGCRVAFLDLTPADVRLTGLTVMRAVSLDLVRQPVGPIARHLNNPRLLSPHARLGRHAEVVTFSDLLAAGHPFP